VVTSRNRVVLSQKSLVNGLASWLTSLAFRCPLRCPFRSLYAVLLAELFRHFLIALAKVLTLRRLAGSCLRSL
jgi:hypothetical protein